MAAYTIVDLNDVPEPSRATGHRETTKHHRDVTYKQPQVWRRYPAVQRVEPEPVKVMVRRV